LKWAPRERPIYFNGTEEILQLRIDANSSWFGTWPTVTNSDFWRLIFKPEIASKHRRIWSRLRIWSRFASHIIRVSYAKRRWEISKEISVMEIEMESR
jgi:hypothetical protein